MSVPQSHLLLVMYRKTLDITHVDQPTAKANYLAQVAKVLHHATQYLEQRGRATGHWSNILTYTEPIVDFIRTYVLLELRWIYHVV